MLFIRLRIFPSIPIFKNLFYHKVMLNFVKCFLRVYWDDQMLSCSLLIWYIALIDFWMLNQSWIFGINFIWFYYTMPVRCCLIWFASILLKMFSSIFIKDIGVQFPFFMMSLTGFSIILVSYNKLRFVPSPFVFCKDWY